MRISLGSVWQLRILAPAIAGLLLTSPAYPCGGFLDVACNLQNGGLSPGNIGRQTQIIVDQTTQTTDKAVQDVANALNELQANVLSGPILEQAIKASRDSARNGAVPIPPQIRQQLTGYASEESMNTVLYKVGDNGFANLARLLEQGGMANAVTLIDVVVFRDSSGAQDAALWAHELTHVDQYLQWGLRSFAVHYTRNSNNVENEAYQKGDGYYAWAQQSGRTIAMPSPMPVPLPAPQPVPAPIVVMNPSGFPRGTMTQACGCWGPTTGFNPFPSCSSGGNIAVACQGGCPDGRQPYAWVCQ
jgi:hypothetical protein